MPEAAHPLVELLQQALTTRHPILYLHSADEARVLAALKSVAKAHGVPLATWSCTTGQYRSASESGEHDPVPAVLSAVNHDTPGFLVLKDLVPFLGRPVLQRALRDAYYALRDRPDARLFILSGELSIPGSLRHNIQILSIPPPDGVELRALADELLAADAARGIDDALRDEIVHALSGLALDEARHVLHAVAAEASPSRAQLLEAVQQAKRSLAAGSAVLEYVVPDRGLDEVGGLSNMKQWIDTRAGLFTPQAVAAGYPVPRGVLLTGVSGCGKSLFAKIVARVWNVPLFRLDMNLVFSGTHGNPEATFHAALRTVEALAPVVLWIDEIENGLGFSEEGGGEAGQLFSAFLTWMQEKPPLVFVAATANRIEFLPPEMLRKGRFDQVFFVDLPDAGEREELFTIHLRRQDGDPAACDLAALVRETEGWSGAEIEQAVSAARVDGLRAGTPFGQAELLENVRQSVPLSQTMNEKIKALRDWAWGRATPASRGKGAYDVSLTE
jgi:hypothetical protein